MNPQDDFTIDSLIESATPEYLALVERDERIWREAMQQRVTPPSRFSRHFEHVDADGVVTNVVPLAAYEQLQAQAHSAREANRLKIVDKNRTIQRFKHAAILAGLGWLITLCAVVGMVSR